MCIEYEGVLQREKKTLPNLTASTTAFYVSLMEGRLHPYHIFSIYTWWLWEWIVA